MPTNPELRDRGRLMLNKVPEVTVYFWVIKILCTTVGESFADYINETLGFGLTNTTLLFSAGLVIALIGQFRLNRYVPSMYWLAVVLISVVGTLLTDNLTDNRGVPLWISSTLFAVLLAAVFGIWYARERTLSIHTIVTTPREAFYWLTVLVTFALGTALGDWTLELTGWPASAAILLPLGLILAVLVAWRLGAGPVLCFWLAYILTRPLGANIGDYLASPRSDGGLGLGTLGTSVLFLGTIAAVVAYLTVTDKDRTERHQPTASTPKPPRPPGASHDRAPRASRPGGQRPHVAVGGARSPRSPVARPRRTSSSGWWSSTRHGPRSTCSTPNGTTRQPRPNEHCWPCCPTSSALQAPTSSDRCLFVTTRWTPSRRPCSQNPWTRSCWPCRKGTSPSGSTRTSPIASHTSTSL